MTKRVLILSVETATLGGSVYVGRAGEELSSRTGTPEVSHSNTLLRDIDESLKDAGVTLADVDLFACALGPGSFTGIRIGIATVKALASTLDRPALGVPTLKAVAHAAGPSQTTVALLPAGRGELFAQAFSVSAEGDVVELDQAAHLSPQKLIEKYRNLTGVMWAGPGAELQSKFLQAAAAGLGFQFGEPDGWTIFKGTPNLARHVAALALRSHQSQNLQTAESLSAIYVRPSDAELNQQCK